DSTEGAPPSGKGSTRVEGSVDHRLQVVARDERDIALAEVAALRKSPGPGPGYGQPALFLKHADEQTVAALASVLAALHSTGMTPEQLSSWGVVACPRFLGRAQMAASYAAFREEGAWGMSPHVIPHHSLHAVSGTISMALQLHGPNVGASGPDEALLVAAGFLARGLAPGVIVVWTLLDAEGALDPAGNG